MLWAGPPRSLELNTWSPVDAGTITRAAAISLVSESADHLVAENVHAVTNNTQSGDATFALDTRRTNKSRGDTTSRLYVCGPEHASDGLRGGEPAQKILSGTKTEAQVSADYLATSGVCQRIRNPVELRRRRAIFLMRSGGPPRRRSRHSGPRRLNAGRVSRADFLDGIAQSSGTWHPDRQLAEPATTQF